MVTFFIRKTRTFNVFLKYFFYLLIHLWKLYILF